MLEKTINHCVQYKTQKDNGYSINLILKILFTINLLLKNNHFLTFTKYV